MRKLLILVALALVSLGVTCLDTTTTTLLPAIAPCSPSLGFCGPVVFTPVVPVTPFLPVAPVVSVTPGVHLTPVGCDPLSNPSCGGIVPIGCPTLDPSCF
jgi:hypothetical protein